MTWIIILSIILFLLAWLLLAPVFLYISTSESKYEAGLKGIFKVMINVDSSDSSLITGKLFFISFNIPVLRARTKKIKASAHKKKKKKMKKMIRKRMRLWFKVIWNVVRTYRLKQFKLNIDTGDVIRNAYLIPVFSMIYRDKVQLSINYENRTEFLIHLQSTTGRILYVMARTYFNQTFKK